MGSRTLYYEYYVTAKSLEGRFFSIIIPLSHTHTQNTFNLSSFLFIQEKNIKSGTRMYKKSTGWVHLHMYTAAKDGVSTFSTLPINNKKKQQAIKIYTALSARLMGVFSPCYPCLREQNLEERERERERKWWKQEFCTSVCRHGHVADLGWSKAQALVPDIKLSVVVADEDVTKNPHWLGQA